MAEQHREHVFPCGIYKGQLKNGKKHENGCMTWNTESGFRTPGDVYTGEWKDDFFHGKGVLKHHNGD